MGSDRRGLSLETLNDAEIIAASERDPACFASIFDRHFTAIHRYLHARVGSTIADDLAAETFTVAFRLRGNYDLRRSNARPWLFGIAANLLRHHRRDERRRFLAYARAGARALPDATWEGVDDRLDARAAVPVLARALAALRPGDREILLLHAWADLTYEEIAEALSLPVGTVRSRLFRARRKLRELLHVGGQMHRENPSAVKGDRDG